MERDLEITPPRLAARFIARRQFLRWRVLAGALVFLIGPGCLRSKAQGLLTGEGARKAEELFQRHPSRASGCSATWTRPRLDWGFRFVAPFHVRSSAERFAGTDNRLVVLLRVTPEGQERVYLLRRVAIPRGIPNNTKVELQVDGALLLGPGRYSIDLLLLDRLGGFCPAHTDMVARLAPRERSVRPSLAPGKVIGLHTPPWANVRNTASGRAGGRLTILLHAQPARYNASRISAAQRSILLGSLASIVRDSAFSRFRVVAFNLDQQVEIFRQDELDAGGYTELAEALANLQLAMVSYSVVRKPLGFQDLLARLVNAELSSPEPAEAIVFVGWTSRFERKMPETMLERVPQSRLRFFYLNYRPYWQRQEEFPDTIERMVKAVGGRTVRVREPRELAAAIHRIDEAAGAPAEPQRK